MTNTELYAVAKKHIGEGGAKARAYCGLPSGAAWCNAYVCYIANEGGVKNLYFDGSKQTYCPTSIKWCNANLAMIPPYLAMPMDIIYFDWQPNGNPDHIGFVKAKKSSEDIYTHEGNTNGGVVAEKVRTVKYILGIYRPLFKPSEADKGVALVCDGDFGWQSIYGLQRALKITADGQLGKGTVKALQKKAGVSADGQWGKGTSKAVQKMIGTTVDGAFGENSVKALQTWINTQNGSSPAPAPSKKSTTIGHACSDIDKKAGDSSGKEVTTAKLTYSKSSTSWRNWTYIVRPKDNAKALKAADMCEKAIKNNNIGYVKNSSKAYGANSITKLAPKVGYDLSKITNKTGLSCGDLVSLCYRYAGISTFYEGTALGFLKKAKATGKFDIIPYKTGLAQRGDAILTAHANGKHNHVVMAL